MSSMLKISAVDQYTQEWKSAYGNTMVTYRVKLEDQGDQVYQLTQKLETTKPKAGDSFLASIDISAKGGPKIVKDYGGMQAGSTNPSYRGSAPKADPKTMYASYAKDVVVALIAAKLLPNDDKFEDAFNTAINLIGVGGEALMQGNTEGKADETAGGF